MSGKPGPCSAFSVAPSGGWSPEPPRSAAVSRWFCHSSWYAPGPHRWWLNNRSLQKVKVLYEHPTFMGVLLPPPTLLMPTGQWSDPRTARALMEGVQRSLLLTKWRTPEDQHPPAPPAPHHCCCPDCWGCRCAGREHRLKGKSYKNCFHKQAQATDVYSLGHGHLFVVLDRAHATDL